jgi:nucleoside-diphosphate-sugar epimerase
VSKILVVGGAGYVGSVLTRELLDRGYAVRVVDRLYFGDALLQDIRDRVDLVVADMRTLSPDVLRDVDGEPPARLGRRARDGVKRADGLSAR